MVIATMAFQILGSSSVDEALAFASNGNSGYDKTLLLMTHVRGGEKMNGSHVLTCHGYCGQMRGIAHRHCVAR